MKRKCPAHKDTNPSLHVYPDHTYCYVCGYRGKPEEILSQSEFLNLRAEPTDIPEMVEYINGLPKTNIRGLYLPTDNTGFYILWPDNKFYKKRVFTGKNRYIGPRGHKVPPLILKGHSKNLVIVEGELNALSLKQVGVAATIISPGSATELTKHLPKYLTFDNISIIVDKDIPGVVWGLQLKDELIKHNKRIELITLETDYNETLQKEGEAGLFKKYKKDVGLF